MLIGANRPIFLSSYWDFRNAQWRSFSDLSGAAEAIEQRWIVPLSPRDDYAVGSSMVRRQQGRAVDRVSICNGLAQGRSVYYELISGVMP